MSRHRKSKERRSLPKLKGTLVQATLGPSTVFVAKYKETEEPSLRRSQVRRKEERKSLSVTAFQDMEVIIHQITTIPPGHQKLINERV